MSSQTFKNTFGIATLSLGNCKHHCLEHRLQEAAKAGFQGVELFDEDWAAYLTANGQDGTHPWEPTDGNLRVARELGQRIKDLGMSVFCVQPIRQIEGWLNPIHREQSFLRVRERFPFMRAFGTDLTFICSHVRSKTSTVTIDFGVVVQHLRQLGEMGAAFAHKDGGPVIRIGYEGLAWADRNTWSSTWEIVRAVNLPNVGLVVDTFHWLSVEWADPTSPTGLAYASHQEALHVVSSSIAAFTATVPVDKNFLVQLADAELISPALLLSLGRDDMPTLQVWSRNCRLFPIEIDRGAYFPIALIVSSILRAGYTGPLSLEVFNQSLYSPDPNVAESHAKRGIESLRNLLQEVCAER
jgi:sugar phosphate isomerase/epimerase